MAALGPRCCMWALSSCSEQGPLFVAVHRLLTAVASPIAEHRLQACGLQELWCTGLVAPWHVGSSRTIARTQVPCIGRRIPNHCTTREAPTAFFLFPFSWNIFFHPLPLSLYVSLGLKWVSCRQHIYGSCFCIHSASLCCLVGAFNPFMFKVIINMYVPIIIFLIVLGLFL